MHNDELAEIQRRAEIISMRAVQSLQSELEALHNRNAAKGRLRSGATVKESSAIARNTVQSYFLALEQFVRSRPIANADFDAAIIDTISRSTATLIAAINDGLLKTATIVGDVKLVSAVTPEVTAELTASQETFRSNIRAYWTSKSSATPLSHTETTILAVEVCCLFASCITIVLWINDHTGFFEPYLALFGLGSIAAEIFRRVGNRLAR